MKVGYYDDGQATRKVGIIGETRIGCYICYLAPVIMIREDGTKCPVFDSCLFLIPKDKVVDIKEEE